MLDYGILECKFDSYKGGIGKMQGYVEIRKVFEVGR